MVKLKDLVNTKSNKRNKQQSLDIRKLKLRELNISVDDILNIDISPKRRII